MTAASNASHEYGTEGERVVEGLLHFDGWVIMKRQPTMYGHRLDFRAIHADLGEMLIEVKVWGAGGGKDTVKKAIADAYDLKAAGCTIPYMLILSEQLYGLNAAMIQRALDSRVIHEVRIIGFKPWPRYHVPTALPGLE